MIDILASDPEAEKLKESDVKICDDIVKQPRSETILYVETQEKFPNKPVEALYESRHCMFRRIHWEKYFMFALC